MAKEQAMPAARSGVSLDEAVLIEQSRSGDMSAFSRLVSRYQDRVLNTCWRLCGNLEDARDLTQEAFLHAMTRLDSFQGKAQFYTWLFRIAVNLALTHRRKAARRPMLSLHTGDGECRSETVAGPAGSRGSEDPAARLSSREVQQRLVQELERLDDEHRAVVVLRDIEGLDYQEIAAVLEVPVGTVRSRLHRARVQLRERLAPLMRD